jgi:hypothetical protein
MLDPLDQGVVVATLIGSWAALSYTDSAPLAPREIARLKCSASSRRSSAARMTG